MQGKNRPAGGAFSVAAGILRQEGIGFFYAGTAPRMLRVCLDVGVTFAVFPVVQQMLEAVLWKPLGM